jgi:hypothetical protein
MPTAADLPGDVTGDGSDAFNEDLGRILLGECGREPGPARGQTAGLKEVLRRARPLVEELHRLARQVGWQAGAVPDQARRFQALVASLADLVRGRGR